MKEFIIINQRTDRFGKFKEKRDNLDIRFTKFILKIGMVPLLIPNDKKIIKHFLNSSIKIKGIILSPGGDPRIKDDRSYVENKLIKHAIRRKLPLLGLCRGAQKLNLYFGGTIKKVRGHVRKNHRIDGKIIKSKKMKVNSYHDYGIKIKDLSEKFNVLAFAGDKTVECFENQSKNILGIMWHPERYPKVRNFDKELIKNFFKCN